MKIITKTQRLQLEGLLTLADKHRRALEDIEEAAHQITDEREFGGVTFDAVANGSFAVDEVLRKLKIIVTE